MKFTYSSYADLVAALIDHGYTLANYHNCDEFELAAILRHDVDLDLVKALEFAEYEHSLGVASTYFVLMSSNFYNVFSKKSQEMINRIQGLGHAVGLHFDQTRYPIIDKHDFEKYAQSELELFYKIIGGDRSLSMHRPSKLSLEWNLDFGDTINTYSSRFFGEYKYLSDSRMQWREDVISIIESGSYDKLQIVTHPVWYQRTERTTKQILEGFLAGKNEEMYRELGENIRDLDEIMQE